MGGPNENDKNGGAMNSIDKILHYPIAIFSTKPTPAKN
jgi:hypothetical protein